MSNNFGSNSGSGLKVKVRMRCGCKSDAFRMAWTVLDGRPTFRAKVRTLQRPCDSGCWQAKVCTFCQTAASCFGGRPERGASRNPSNPNAANDRRHFPTVTSGVSRSEAICWFAWPAAAAKTIRLLSTSACAVDGACTQRFKVVLVFGSRPMVGAIRGMSQRTRSSLYYKELSGRCTSFHTHSYLSASTREITIELLRLFAMCQTLFLKFSGVAIHRSYLLRPGVKIHSYNDHCSAPFSEPVGWFLAPPTLLGPGSRHCHGINYTHCRVLSVSA